MTKPNQLKRFEGNPGQRPIGRDPSFTGVPVRPEGMSANVAWFWDLVVPQLANTGVASAVDSAAIISTAQWWGRYREAMAMLEGEGINDRRAVMIASTCYRNFLAGAQQLGITPVSRNKLAAMDAGDSAADFDAFLACEN